MKYFLLFFVLFTLLLSPVQAQATFTVNTTGDGFDANVGNGICATNAPIATCTLRAAIEEANFSAATRDTIRFSVGTGLQQFTATLAGGSYPTISTPVIIDGKTQPGYSGIPIIQLHNNLLFTGGNSEVSGLVVRTITLQNVGGNHVYGNYIGTDPTGTVSSDGLSEGVLITTSNNNLIGGSTPAERNVISGNQFSGVIIQNGSQNNTVSGNYIGVTADGSAALPNDGSGVFIFSTSSTGNIISGNVISGNTQNGVGMEFANFTTIQNNTIGLNAAGTSPIPNLAEGIGSIDAGDTTINGNTIAASGRDGIDLFGEGGYFITNNKIGTDVTGTVAFGNTNNGIYLFNTTGSFVSGNIISGNNGNGILLNSTGNVIIFNRIGTNDGGAVLGNTGNGIQVDGSGNLIGIGADSSLGTNTIAYNGGNGIHVPTFNNNRLRYNSIYDNGLMGIDIGIEDITLNDSGDVDGGGNNRQNFPEIRLITFTATEMTINGRLDSEASKTYALDFYASADCEANGYGEGQTHFGTTTITTDTTGYAPFTVTLPRPVTQIITATATDPDGNTSEFSLCHGGDILAASSLINGGFESGPNAAPTGWIPVNLSKDKRKCNNDIKLWSFEGNCAFKFKGGPTGARLIQTIRPITSEGATVTLSGYVRGTNLSGNSGMFKLKVVYPDTSANAVKKLKFAPGTYPYTKISDSVILTGAVRKISVTLIYNGKSGNAALDGINLQVIPPAR